MKRQNGSKKCRRFRQMSNRVSKRSTLHLRSSPRRSVVIFEICLIRYGEGAESVARNVEISTPVELPTLRRSTIHFAQSPAPVAQPSFAQVLDSVARTNVTLASQMPVLNAKAIRVPGPSRLESWSHIKNGGFTFCDEVRLYLQVLSCC